MCASPDVIFGSHRFRSAPIGTPANLHFPSNVNAFTLIYGGVPIGCRNTFLDQPPQNLPSAKPSRRSRRPGPMASRAGDMHPTRSSVNRDPSAHVIQLMQLDVPSALSRRKGGFILAGLVEPWFRAIISLIGGRLYGCRRPDPFYRRATDRRPNCLLASRLTRFSAQFV
jgi:hypothetical protein